MHKKLYVPPTIKRNVNNFLDKHGHGNTDEIVDKIDGVSIDKLVEQYGSPLFVFSEKKLREKYREAYRAFSTRYPKVQFAWSYKTNYLRAICSVFHSEGSIAEVVSDFEYEKARNLGIPGDQIILNGPYKTDAILRQAIAEQAKIQIDNFHEIGELEEIAAESDRTVDVAIRVNLETGCEPAWSKFGFNYENGDAMLAIKRIYVSRNLRLVGLHSHIGTFILDPGQYEISISKLVRLLWAARDQFGIQVEYINAGGGFASANTLHFQYLPGKEVVPSFQQYAEAICGTLNENLPRDMPQPTLYLETGRALVDEAGHLITTVVDSRRTGDGGRAIVVDAGVNLLYTAAWYKFDIQPAQESHGPIGSTKVYGPLCMNIDVVREDAPLPHMNPGDRLVVHPVGAYNVTQSMQFIAYRPAVVIIGSNGQVDVIRQGENLEYVEGLEQVPERLQTQEPTTVN